MDKEFYERECKELRTDVKILRNLAKRIRNEYEKETGKKYMRFSAEELILLGGSRSILRGRPMHIRTKW